MLRYLLFISITFMSLHLKSQGFKEKSFHKMIKTMLSHSVDEVYAKDLSYDSSIVYLDAREIKEYNVSRIENAQWVGYDDFDLSRVKKLDKDKEIVVYCSIGYRSEKIAEKLKAEGFTNVSNMLGGIFEWANYENKLVDSSSLKTKKIHGFSRAWGIWLDGDKSEKVY